MANNTSEYHSCWDVKRRGLVAFDPSTLVMEIIGIYNQPHDMFVSGNGLNGHPIMEILGSTWFNFRWPSPNMRNELMVWRRWHPRWESPVGICAIQAGWRWTISRWMIWKRSLQPGCLPSMFLSISDPFFSNSNHLPGRRLARSSPFEWADHQSIPTWLLSHPNGV